ncbi:MAG: response regulator receiver modulated metal dependent phosphohydrolase, partial [Desulfomicrobiaceae bacterium]|nr:response regulator receiver modulated metal dependent phosphohydrolase [Desulfomicrobiaceae bacterium]
MHADEEPLIFAAEGPEDDGPQGPPWKVLVVDDDEFVHRITELALHGYRFQGRGLLFLHAQSAAAARGLLAQHPDIAVIFLDVVMETEQAGLDLVRYVRDELGNSQVRIILRTGQPGRAPERSVVLDYDINDYKQKAELSELKLMTSLTAALRAYEQMQTLALARDGMAALALGTSRMLALRTEAQFAAAALDTVQSVAEAAACRVCAMVGRVGAHGVEPIVASNGVTGPWLEQASTRLAACAGAFAVEEAWFVARFVDGGVAVVAEFSAPVSPVVRQVLDTLALQLALALDNVFLHREVTETQG